MSALIGALRASLSLETAQFEAGAKRAQRTNNQLHGSFKKTFGSIGGMVKAGVAGLVAGLSVGLFTAGIKGALNYAASLGEVAQQLGVTTRDLQTFRYAAGQAGISQEEMDKGLARLTKSMGDAQAGSKTMIVAFDAIGISVDDLKGKDAGQVFRLMADGLAKIPDAAQRAAVETAIFGRAGQKLDTLLAGGSKAINELSMAAEKLGIVLSDEQIQKADETADKLDALKTVLSAQIAGAVANNADAILGLANALVELVGTIGQAMNAWRQMEAQFNSGVFSLFGNDKAAARWRGSNFQSGKQPTIPGKSVTIDLAPAKTPKPLGGGSIKPFLGTGGGKKSARAPRDTSLRDAFQFDSDLRRAQMDVLQATRDLAHDYVERTALSIAMLDLDKQGYDAGLAYQVAAGEISKAQAEQLRLKFDETDMLRRKAILEDEQFARQRDYNMLEEKDFDLKATILEKQASLAETASERRRIELELLNLAYEEKRRTLERIVRESKDWAEIEAARRELLTLSQNQSLDRQAVMQSTRGPMEDYFSSVPQNAAEAQEAMEALKVQGIDGAINSIIALQGGFDDMRDTAIAAIKQIIAELIRMQLMKLAFNLLGAASDSGGADFSSGGGVTTGSDGYVGIGSNLPGFATGGGFTIGGNRGTDRNIMSLNGLPIARVSHGERVNISNDNQGFGGSVSIGDIHVHGPVNDPRATGNQIAAAMRQRIARANQRGY